MIPGVIEPVTLPLRTEAFGEIQSGPAAILAGAQIQMWKQKQWISPYLIREWQGRIHNVIAAERGCEYQGQLGSKGFFLVS